MSVELPRDAEGREVPLDTKTLYDEYGRPIKVSAFQYYPEFKKWLMRGLFNAAEMSSRVSKCYLTAPDSWEKLLEDLKSGANAETFQSCHYAHCNELTCEKCRFYADAEGRCKRNAFADIADRIRKLRGEDE